MGVRRGGQLKNGLNSDGSGWLLKGRERKAIHRNWMSRAIVSINVTRVQTAFHTGAWSCYKCSKQVSGSALDSILVLFLVFQVRRVCLSVTAEY